MKIRIVDDGATWAHGFEAALREQCTQLSMAVEFTSGEAALAAGEALVYFFAADATPSAQLLAEAALRCEQGHMVLPVVRQAEDARGLPPELGRLNAFICSAFADTGTATEQRPAWHDALIDEVLANLWLRRRQRKIFISYKRDDSEGIAQQITQHFRERRFDVFLDTSAIDYGADFQRELMSWLNDTDLVLLLLSPRIGKSTWVLKEVEFAQRSQIGLVGVQWPGEFFATPPAPSALPFDGAHDLTRPTLGDTLFSDQLVALTTAELQDVTHKPGEHRLTNAGLARVMQRVMQARARAIHNRLQDLLPLAQAQLEDDCGTEGRTLRGSEVLGDFAMLEAGAPRGLVRVVPFRPSLETLVQIHDHARDGHDGHEVAGCFYRENDPGSAAARALQWAADASRGTRPQQFRLWPWSGK